MTTIKTFIIAHTLLISTAVLCMEQGNELTLKQKVASVKAKQALYFDACDTVGVHAGGEPALRGIGAACAFLAVRDIHSVLKFPETAPYRIPAAFLNAFGCYVMHRTSDIITTKKTNAEKDITTLLADLDALLAEDATIKPQQVAVGTLHTQIATHRTVSKAYLAGTVISLLNVLNTGYSAYALHPLFKENCDLNGHLAREFLLQNFVGLAAVAYSYYQMTQEKTVLKAEKVESRKLTNLVNNLLKPLEANDTNE
jgi:hypothetical protein